MLPIGSKFFSIRIDLFSEHYENTPIQISIENFTTKQGKFLNKNSDIFHIPAQNIDCGEAVLTSTHNRCFLAK